MLSAIPVHTRDWGVGTVECHGVRCIRIVFIEGLIRRKIMSKWVDTHKIMIEEGQWYVTVEDVEDLIEEFNKEIEIVRARIK